MIESMTYYPSTFVPTYGKYLAFWAIRRKKIRRELIDQATAGALTQYISDENIRRYGRA